MIKSNVDMRITETTNAEQLTCEHTTFTIFVYQYNYWVKHIFKHINIILRF